MRLTALPAELIPIQEKTKVILNSIKSVPIDRFRPKSYHKRTDAGRELPEYYLVYFLLVDLMSFAHFGPEEKVSWIIPIEYKNVVFTVEHRKMGLGVFCESPEANEVLAREIVIKIQKATKAAKLFYEWVANEAVSDSKMNIRNKSSNGYCRYKYFFSLYSSLSKNINELIEKKQHAEIYQLKKSAQWLTIAGVDAFFSWTEHVFVLMAALMSYAKTSREVVQLAESDWGHKFKTIFNISDADAKKYYDDLSSIRYELRNYQTHGAFGKKGEGFTFHSDAGAVPLFLPHRADTRKYSII